MHHTGQQHRTLQWCIFFCERGTEGWHFLAFSRTVRGPPLLALATPIGVPDAKYGEEIVAWIKLKPGVQMSEEEITAFCRGTIAHYKVPRSIKFVETFPMTVTGKIQKFLMREQSIEALGWQHAAASETAEMAMR